MKSEKYNIWKIIGFIASMLCIIISVTTDENEYADSSWKNQEFEGYIVSKYIDSAGHYARFVEIILSSKITSNQISKDSVYNIIENGDYIIKKRGVRDLILVKGFDTMNLRQ